MMNGQGRYIDAVIYNVNTRKKELKISNKELSARSNVPIGTLEKILAGTTQNPTIEVIKALATALGLTCEQIISKEPLNNIQVTRDDLELYQNLKTLNDTDFKKATELIQRTFINKKSPPGQKPRQTIVDLLVSDNMNDVAFSKKLDIVMALDKDERKALYDVVSAFLTFSKTTNEKHAQLYAALTGQAGEELPEDAHALLTEIKNAQG